MQLTKQQIFVGVTIIILLIGVVWDIKIFTDRNKQAGYKCEGFYFFGKDLGKYALAPPITVCNATSCVIDRINESFMSVPYYCEQLERADQN